MSNMAEEVVAERIPVRTLIGVKAYFIKYKPGHCTQCNQFTYWRSVDGMCWSCTAKVAKNKAIKREHHLAFLYKEFNPWSEVIPKID